MVGAAELWFALGMVCVDRPKGIDIGNGAQDGLTSFAFICSGFPLEVEAWLAKCNSLLGVLACMPVANGVEACDRVGYFCTVFIVFEHMGFDPNMHVGVWCLPSGALVEPDPEVLGGVNVSGIEACFKRALVIVDD